MIFFSCRSPPWESAQYNGFHLAKFFVFKQCSLEMTNIFKLRLAYLLSIIGTLCPAVGTFSLQTMHTVWVSPERNSI